MQGSMEIGGEPFLTSSIGSLYRRVAVAEILGKGCRAFFDSHHWRKLRWESHEYTYSRGNRAHWATVHLKSPQKSSLY